MPLEKVTAFVTRPGRAGSELLLFRHPNEGIQLPAGTVEEGEATADAVVREVIEETGLRDVTIERALGHIDETLPGRLFVMSATRVYARPDPSSFDWAEFRRGIAVKPQRVAGTFTQVSYEEWDAFPVGEYITYQITGWVPWEGLAAKQRRHFFHLKAAGGGPLAWTHFADSHVFQPFWAPLHALPRLIEFQQRWLEHVTGELGIRFD